MPLMKIGTAALREALFDNGPDAVLCVDAEGLIVAANPRAGELFGYAPGELIGLPIEALFPDRFQEGDFDDRLRFFEDPKARPLGGGLNVLGLRKDGSQFPAGINLSPQVSRHGSFVAVTVADITELRDAEKQLRASEERYRHLIENTPDGYFITENSIITFMNPSGLQMFGAKDASEALGTSIIDFMNGSEALDTEQRLELIRQGTVTLPFVPRTMRRVDGTTFEAEVGTVGVPASDGTVTAQTIIRDLTTIRKAEQLQIRALAAEESERMKSTLLSTVSHELRTPLAAVRGYATTVIEYADFLDTKEILEYVSGIDSAAQHLEKIVSDLLTLSRIESGVYRLDLTDFDLYEFVRKAVEAYRVGYPNHEVYVECSASDTLVSADSTRVLQVFHNLVDNARKYGGESGLTQVTIARETGGEVAIKIHDQGPGVEPDSLDRIFQPFVRGTSNATTSVTGSGLGLAVCKAIVEAHGGQISASLPSSGGFEISFSLPGAAVFVHQVA